MAISPARWSGHARGGYCQFEMSVESTSPSRPTAKQWVFGFEEGSAEMRCLLGGKGANLAEMTHVLGVRQGPRGIHDHHGGLRRVHEDRRAPSGGARGRDRPGRHSPRAGRGPAVRRRQRSVAPLRALGRPCLDARHARHGPQSRPERRVRGGPVGDQRQPPFCLGLLSAARADVLGCGPGRSR